MLYQCYGPRGAASSVRKYSAQGAPVVGTNAILVKRTSPGYPHTGEDPGWGARVVGTNAIMPSVPHLASLSAEKACMR